MPNFLNNPVIPEAKKTLTPTNVSASAKSIPPKKSFPPSEDVAINLVLRDKKTEEATRDRGPIVLILSGF